MIDFESSAERDEWERDQEQLCAGIVYVRDAHRTYGAAPPDRATTRRCRRFTAGESRYCWQHQHLAQPLPTVADVAGKFDITRGKTMQEHRDALWGTTSESEEA